MKIVSDRSLTRSVRVVHGQPHPGRINLFAIIKNEIYYLPAFLDHYRRLGVEKFFVVDDRSTDGSLEFLTDQSDCVVLHSEYSYGEQVKLKGKFQFFRTRRARAGVEFKRLIPPMVSEGRWCIYADADEFLILPHCFENLRVYTNFLDQNKVRLVLSSMTDFYPANVKSLFKKSPPPSSFSDLIRLAPFFDNVKSLEFDKTGQVYEKSLAITDRLLIKHRIPDEVARQKLIQRTQGDGKSGRSPGARKTSIFKPSKTVYMKGSHSSSVAPPRDMLNCIAHFKFTPDLPRRISLALETQAWANGSRKYDYLKQLLETMSATDGNFLDGYSMRFEDVSQLEACGRIIFK